MKKVVVASALIIGCFLASCKSHTACAAYTKAKDVKVETTERAG